MTNLLVEASKAANGDGTDSAGNTASTVPYR